MPKSSQFANEVLALIFHGTTISGIAQNHSSPVTTLTLALHTSDPGAGGDMTTNEATYTSYARITAARDSGTWDLSGNTIQPLSDLPFPKATGGSETITHISIGTGVSNNKMFTGALTPSIIVSTNVTPIIDTGTVITET
jgi:hypothetical protein